MSNSIYDVATDASYTTDNAMFDVYSGASLSLTGSSDTVILESGSIGLTVSGNGDTVFGQGADGVRVTLSGTGNVAKLGANSNVTDAGNGDNITVGTGSNVQAAGSNTTVNATGGGSSLFFMLNQGGVANANNDSIRLYGASGQVNGNGNQISLTRGNSSVSLNGNSNTVYFDSNTMEMAQTASGSVTREADGSVVLAGSAHLDSVTLSGGVATVQLGNGNAATFGGVASGSTFEYVDASGAVTTSVLMDSNLLHLQGNVYQVTDNALAKMDSTVFDVMNGATFNLTGSSDTVKLESASTATVSGTNNVIDGTGATGTGLFLSGTGNVAKLGANAYAVDFGNVDIVTVGAGSSFTAFGGTGATVNDSQGGGYLTFNRAASGVANANNDSITLLAASAQVNGSGNGINLTGSGNTLNLNGSNNSISFSANGGTELIQTAAGYWMQEATDGSISFSASSLSVKNGVAIMGLGDGNVVTISNVRSSSNGGATTVDNQVNQLVSAMASYQGGASGVSSTLMTQTQADTQLFASSHH